MKVLNTERLILRHFQPSDLYDFHEYATSDLVGPNAGWQPHASMDDTRRTLSRYIAMDMVWAITERSGGKMIGSISLTNDRMRELDSAMRMGYSMNPAYWGRGYMTEAAKAVIAHAFDDLRIEILSVDHFPDNSRSQRVIEKCGFKFEGELRRSLRLYDGRVVDLKTYSISSDEYILTRSGFKEVLFSRSQGGIIGRHR